MEIEHILFSTTDPKTNLPAMTTMLYRVCENDEAKFEEACRLINLFIERAVAAKP